MLPIFSSPENTSAPPLQNPAQTQSAALSVQARPPALQTIWLKESMANMSSSSKRRANTAAAKALSKLEKACAGAAEPAHINQHTRPMGQPNPPNPPEQNNARPVFLPGQIRQGPLEFARKLFISPAHRQSKSPVTHLRRACRPGTFPLTFDPIHAPRMEQQHSLPDWEKQLYPVARRLMPSPQTGEIQYREEGPT